MSSVVTKSETVESASPAVELGSAVDVRLAEFKALRDESLRCAQLLANAVWVAVTGYAVTIAAGAAFLGRAGAGGLQVKEALLVPSIVALLCVQAIAISAMYMSELWKYIRVGAYVREHIEPHVCVKASDGPIYPMQWEQWIESHRAWELYLGSLVFLQLPVGFAALGIAVSLLSSPAEPGTVKEFIGWLIAEPSLALLIAIVILADVLVVSWLGVRLVRARKGIFDQPSLRDAVSQIFTAFRRT